MQTTLIRNGLQGVTRDVTELRTLQEHLAAPAQRDPLTGLANRPRLVELLESALTRASLTCEVLTLAFVDLDRFKAVNDMFGHDAGDAVLCETAHRLLAVAGDNGIVARLGGDEFVVAFEPDVAASERILQLQQSLDLPVSIQMTETVRCSASIGYADDARRLMAAGDRRMRSRGAPERIGRHR